MTKNQILHSAVVIFLVFNTWTLPPATGENLPAQAEEFSLLDQYGKQYQIIYPQEKICVFVFADKWGCTQVEGWVRPLYEHYEDTIMILGVAQLTNVPGWLKPMIISIFKRTIKFSVMMDWSGDVCAAYGYPGGKAFVVITDSEGTIRHRVIGKASTDLVEECFEIIGRLG